ncbi:MAG TPA: hypothetical protein VGM90_05210 [Kofleriaceae bacterium]|jgi:hypothetical protein
MKVLCVVLVLALFASVARAEVLDYDAKSIQAKIVYWFFKKTNNGDHGKLERRGTDADTYDLLPLDLGKIRDWTTSFDLYRLPTGAAFSQSRRKLLADSDGVILLVDASPKSTKANAASLAELRKDLKELNYEALPIVVQIVGANDEKDATAAAKALGIEDLPRLISIPTKGVGVFDTLKAEAKLVLTALRDRN